MKPLPQPEETLNRVISSDPVNSLARQVTQPGVHFNFKKNITQRHWTSPPPMLPIPRGEFNLSGKRFGRFTVVGLFRERHKNHRLWVVRCACGCYETRRSKAIHNPNNSCDCCDNCRHLLFLKRTTLHRQGKEVEWKDL